MFKKKKMYNIIDMDKTIATKLTQYVACDRVSNTTDCNNAGVFKLKDAYNLCKYDVGFKLVMIPYRGRGKKALKPTK